MRAKQFSLVLHSHIPYVLAHGSWPHGMDWPFLISTWTARDYSENRAAEHFERAQTLFEWIKKDAPMNPDQAKLLETWEEEDQLFSEVVIPDGRIV